MVKTGVIVVVAFVFGFFSGSYRSARLISENVMSAYNDGKKACHK